MMEIEDIPQDIVVKNRKYYKMLDQHKWKEANLILDELKDSCPDDLLYSDWFELLDETL